MSAQIQAGQRFSLAVPVGPDTTIELVSAPPGVTATLEEAAGGTSVARTVKVEPDTPRGAYNLALLATPDGEEVQLAWPFEVVEPDATATTVPGSVAAQLNVDFPQVGDVVPSSFAISGVSTNETVGYLLADDRVLAEGTIEVVDGAFSATIEFTDTCCTEVRLEVIHLDAGGMSLTIPLSVSGS